MSGTGFRGPFGRPGLVGRPSRMSETPSWMSRSGRGTLQVLWVWSVGPSGCPGVVARPLQMSGSGREAYPHVPVDLSNIQ